MTVMDRNRSSLSIACTTSLATTPAFKFGASGMAGGNFAVPTGATAVTATFYGAHSDTGTFLPVSDATVTAGAVTVAGGNRYPIPDGCFGCEYLKVTMNVATTVQFDMSS